MKMPAKKKPNVYIATVAKTYVDFADNTSIHGLKYTVMKDTTVFEKVLWTFIVVLGVVGSLFMVQVFWDRYTSNPTRTTFETIFAPTTAIPFPAVTICHINTMFTSKVDAFIKRLDLFDNDEEDIRKIFPQLVAYFHNSYFNVSDLERLQLLLEKNDYGNPRVIFRKFTPTCNELMVKCQWEMEVVDCGKIFVPSLTHEGVCCSFNYNIDGIYAENYTQFYGMQMGLTVLLDPMVQAVQYSRINSTGLKVLIHNPTDYPGTGSLEKILGTGRQTLLQISGRNLFCSDDVRALTISQRDCVFPEERSLQYFSAYAGTDCVVECYIRFVHAHCGCVPFYYPGNPACNISKIPCLNHLITHGALFPEFMKSKCICERQCDDVYYSVLSTSTKIYRKEHLTSSFLVGTNTTDEHMLLHVFFASQTQTILRRDTITSTIYLLSSFGGIFSLFLGCSFMSGAEIIYYVFVRFLVNLKILNRLKPKKDAKKLEKKAIQVYYITPVEAGRNNNRYDYWGNIFIN